MDFSFIYCLSLIFIVGISLMKKKYLDFSPAPKPLRKRLSTSRSSTDSICSNLEERRSSLHNIETLKLFTISELEQLNSTSGKVSDRYWREIFRRNNSSHSPDTVIVSNLSTQNIVTVLEELLHNKAASLDVIGLPQSSLEHVQTLKYLRNRLGPKANIDVKEEVVRIQWS